VTVVTGPTCEPFPEDCPACDQGMSMPPVDDAIAIVYTCEANFFLGIVKVFPTLFNINK